MGEPSEIAFSRSSRERLNPCVTGSSPHKAKIFCVTMLIGFSINKSYLSVVFRLPSTRDLITTS